jgi:hypothetical protein
MSYNQPPGKFSNSRGHSGDGSLSLNGRSDARFTRAGDVEPDDFRASRMVQGEVTANRTFNDFLFEARTDNTIACDASDRIDHVRERKDLYIWEGDLLLAPAANRALDGRVLVRNQPAHLAAPDVFGTMRGMYIQKADSENYDQWQRSFVFSGFSKTKIEVGVNTDGTVVAAAVGGGMSVPVNNSQSIQMGRMLRYKVPDPRPEERHREHMRHKNLGYEVDVCKPIIEMEEPEDMLQLPISYLHQYLKNFSAASASIKQFDQRDQMVNPETGNLYNVDTSASDNMRFFHAEFLEGSAVDALNYVALFARLDLIKFNLPVSGDPAQHAALNALSTLTAENTHKELFEITDGKPEALKNDALTAKRTALKAQTLVLAGLLGLVNHSNVPAVPSLRDLLMRTRLRGIMNPVEHSQHRSHIGIVQTAPATEQEKELLRLQDNRSRRSVHAFYRLYYGLGRQRIGRATAHGGMGKEVDLVF